MFKTVISIQCYVQMYSSCYKHPFNFPNDHFQIINCVSNNNKFTTYNCEKISVTLYIKVDDCELKIRIQPIRNKTKRIKIKV